MADSILDPSDPMQFMGMLDVDTPAMQRQRLAATLSGIGQGLIRAGMPGTVPGQAGPGWLGGLAMGAAGGAAAANDPSMEDRAIKQALARGQLLKLSNEFKMQEFAKKLIASGMDPTAAGAGTPTATSGTPTATTGATATPQAQELVSYLMTKHGIPPLQAAVMVGNLQQESGLDPTKVHDSGTGYGMGGWRLERRDALNQYAQQRGGANVADPKLQLDFYVDELKSRPEWQQFSQAQDPRTAATSLMNYFRPAGWTPDNPAGGHGFANRLLYSQSLIPGGAQPPASPPTDGGWIPGAQPPPSPVQTAGATVPGAVPQATGATYPPGVVSTQVAPQSALNAPPLPPAPQGALSAPPLPPVATSGGNAFAGMSDQEKGSMLMLASDPKALAVAMLSRMDPYKRQQMLNDHVTLQKNLAEFQQKLREFAYTQQENERKAAFEREKFEAQKAEERRKAATEGRFVRGPDGVERWVPSSQYTQGMPNIDKPPDPGTEAGDVAVLNKALQDPESSKTPEYKAAWDRVSQKNLIDLGNGVKQAPRLSAYPPPGGKVGAEPPTQFYGTEKFTESQNKNHYYVNRLDRSIPQLEAMVRQPDGSYSTANLPSWTQQRAMNSGKIPEFMVAGPAKEYRRVINEILTAILRPESGATIQDSEFERETNKYVPQPGDPPDVVRNKIEALKNSVRGLAETTGRPTSVYPGTFGQQSTEVPAAAGAPTYRLSPSGKLIKP